MGILERLSQVFGAEPAAAVDAQERIRLAAAVLLVEIARADYDHDPGEAAAVRHALQTHFGLDADAARDLAARADQERDTAVSFDPYLKAINGALHADEKRELMVFMWRVAFADGELHHYEEHLLRRICELLHLPHSAFIQTKFAAQGRHH